MQIRIYSQCAALWSHQVQSAAPAGAHSSHNLHCIILRLMRRHRAGCSKVSLLLWTRAALRGGGPGTNSVSDELLWGSPEPREHNLSTCWLICFPHLPGRRISGCCKRSRCTIAAEDHPETAGRGEEGFPWRRACGGNGSLKLQTPRCVCRCALALCVWSKVMTFLRSKTVSPLCDLLLLRHL